MKDVSEILKESGIVPTPVRMMVYKCLKDSKYPLSLTEIETLLDSVDKSTISRTLSTFKNKHLVHSFNDGSGSMKYEICNACSHDDDDDMHIHFRCSKCGKTICMNSLLVPIVKLPPEFIVQEVSYVMTGVCSDCSKDLIK